MSKNIANQITNEIKATQGSTARANNRERPYDGQPHTTEGIRGAKIVEGLTMRDIRDCYVKGALRASGDDELLNLAENNDWLQDDIYRIDWSQVDPIAVAQNMGVEIEKMMGIFPNIPDLKFSMDDIYFITIDPRETDL